jgi:four helix bundle protein
MNQYKGYKDLDCYKRSRELRMFISDLVKKFTQDEKFHLTAQIKRSSLSVTANIAKGYGRYTYADTRNLFIIARGSVTETMEHLATAFDEKYIAEVALSTGEENCKTALKLINEYIAHLDRSKKELTTSKS